MNSNRICSIKMSYSYMWPFCLQKDLYWVIQLVEILLWASLSSFSSSDFLSLSTWNSLSTQTQQNLVVRTLFDLLTEPCTTGNVPYRQYVVYFFRPSPLSYRFVLWNQCAWEQTKGYIFDVYPALHCTIYSLKQF